MSEKLEALGGCAIILGIIAVAVLVVSLIFCGFNTSPGDGEKIGQVVKISRQGLVSKTWEAQLIRGGMSGGNGSFGTVPFDFTIEDEEMAKKAIEYMQSQTEVVIKYRMECVYSRFRTESEGHFLISITPAKK